MSETIDLFELMEECAEAGDFSEIPPIGFVGNEYRGFTVWMQPGDDSCWRFKRAVVDEETGEIITAIEGSTPDHADVPAAIDALLSEQ